MISDLWEQLLDRIGPLIVAHAYWLVRGIAALIALGLIAIAVTELQLWSASRRRDAGKWRRP